MSTRYERVREMMQAFGQATPQRLMTEAEFISKYPHDRCSKLVMEEALEFSDACQARDRTAAVDALIDTLVVTYGALIAMGVAPGTLEVLFSEVHRSNMLKTTGPVRSDGKRLKPEGWTPPDVKGTLSVVDLFTEIDRMPKDESCAKGED